jgi:uncharacterized membrane protein
MTAKATRFVQAWLQENLACMPSTDRVESVEQLTLRCFREASAAGITEDEIEDEIGDLKSFIKEAIDSGNLVEIDEEESE